MMYKTFERIILGKKSLAAFSYELEIQNIDGSSFLSSVTLFFGAKILTKLNVSVPVKHGNIQELEKKAMEAVCRHMAGNVTQPDEFGVKKYPQKGYKTKRTASVCTQEGVQDLFSSFNL